MYHYANRPSKSTERSRQTITRFFNTSVDGLPGNDGNALFFSLPFPNPTVSPRLLTRYHTTRQWRNGQLHVLQHRRVVPCSSNAAVPPLLPILPERVVLQPAVQHHDDHPHEEFFRYAAEDIRQGASRIARHSQG